MPERDYYSRAPKFNLLLMEKFDYIYKRIVDLITEVTSKPAAYAKDWAIPGFHIFIGKAIEIAANDRAHVDHQHLQLVPNRNVKDSLSFTLPIGLPNDGGGLQVWESNTRTKLIN